MGITDELRNNINKLLMIGIELELEEMNNYVILRGIRIRGNTDIIRIPKGIDTISTENGQSEGIRKIILPDTVKEIGYNSFRNFIDLEHIELNDGLNKIHSFAFQGCWELKSIEIPASVKFIDDFAFFGCRKLKKVVFNEGLEDIGVGVFGNCDSLGDINLPKGLKRIGKRAFIDCVNIKEIDIKDIERIELNAFRSLMLNTLRIDLPYSSIIKILDFDDIHVLNKNSGYWYQTKLICTDGDYILKKIDDKTIAEKVG